MSLEQFASSLLDEIGLYIRKGKPCVNAARKAAANDPSVCDIWFSPVENQIIVRRTHSSPFGEKIAGMETLYFSAEKLRLKDCWCGLALSQSKTASLWENLQGITGWNDTFYPPSPLAAMLATGLLGAGLGYGGAALASSFLPRDWDKRNSAVPDYCSAVHWGWPLAHWNHSDIS